MLRLAALGLGLIHTRSGGQPKPGRRVGLPALHLDHAIIDVELEVVDEPVAELAERQAVAHRHRARADEAFPAGPQRQALDRAPGRIGPVEHPHALAMLGRGLEHVEQRGDEGVDAAAEVLEVDQDRVERAHRLAGRAANLAVEAEHRNAVDRIGEIVRLHHIVLLVAAQPVLRTERGGELDAGSGQRIEAVGQVARDRGGMGEQARRACLPAGGEAPARRAAGRYRTGSCQRCLGQVRGEASGVVEVGLVAGRDGRAPSRIWCRPVLRAPRTGRVPNAVSASTAMVAPSAHQVRLSSTRM